MNELQIFKKQEFGQIRTIVIDGEPWFVGKDVATSLGYAKPENAIANHVDDDDKTSTLIQGSGSNYKSKATLINESGLYSLVLSSKLPTAKQFKHWVTSDVLPTIRKTGKYAVPKITPNPHYRTRMIKTAVKDVADTATMIADTFGVKKPMAMTAAMQMVGKAYGVDMTPLKRFIPAETNPSTLTPTMIARELGILNSKGNPSPQRVNAMLKDKGLQEKVGNDWAPTAAGKPYCERVPYTHGNGHSGYQLLWGHHILELLKDGDQEAGH